MGCHLCEQAKELIARSSTTRIPLEECEIADDETLLADYGTRIPVLRTSDGRELDWPFDEQTFLAWYL